MIRSILYLDEQKLYSLSSQVLEGVTEYLHTQTNSDRETTESQKGPVGSGRALADAIKHSTTSVERRVLHDHAFSLFEKKLLELNLVSDLGIESDAPYSSTKSFVRVSAPASFIDAAQLTNLLGVFNRLGEAIACVTNNETIQMANSALENAKSTTKDKARLAELTKQTKALTDTAQLAKSTGLYQDPKFLDSLGKVCTNEC